MNDRHGRWGLVAAVGGVSVLAASAWAVSAFDAGSGSVATSPQSWLLLFAVPAVSLVSVVGVTWYLLAREDRFLDTDDVRYVLCVSCGRSILQEWRLCPYCGSRVEPHAADDPAARNRS